ncbi:MAG: hypothetical protein EPN30_06105 [Actinomycetota bacterium]|nr:MAG: hypothetical protein EPN30_06105 [Actinomycetota bacterium]
MLLAIVASMWAAVITIPLIVRWRDSRHVTSVGSFSKSLGVLGHQCSTSMTAIPGRQSVRRSSWTILTKFGRVEPEVVLQDQYRMMSSQPSRVVDYKTRVSRLAHHQMIRRRKNIMATLLASTFFLFVVNLLLGSRIVELLTLLTFLALISYVGLLIQFKKAAFN